MKYNIDALRKLNEQTMEAGCSVVDAHVVDDVIEEYMVAGNSNNNIFVTKGLHRIAVDRENFMETFRESPIFWLPHNDLMQPVYANDTVYYADGTPAVVIKATSDMNIVVRSVKSGLCTEDVSDLVFAQIPHSDSVTNILTTLSALSAKDANQGLKVSSENFNAAGADLIAAKRNATTNTSKFLIADILKYFENAYFYGNYSSNLSEIWELINYRRSFSNTEVHSTIIKEAVAAVNIVIAAFDQEETVPPENKPSEFSVIVDQVSELDSLKERVAYLETYVRGISKQQAETTLSRRVEKKFPAGLVFYIDIDGCVDSEPLSDLNYDLADLCDSKFAFGSYTEAVAFLERIDV